MKENVSKIKEKLIKRDGNYCSICGTESSILDIENTFPLLAPNIFLLSNLRLICPECNYQSGKRNFREYEFEKYLSDLIKLNKDFSDIQLEKRVGTDKPKQIDIYTKHKKEELFIEAKIVSFVDDKRVKDILRQLLIYKKEIKTGKMIFAFPGVIEADKRQEFDKNNIEIWDIPAITELFKNEIPKVPHSFFQRLFGKYVKDHIEKNLIHKLENTKSGKKEWSIYQKLLNEILARLFCPPLSNPLYELSDEFQVNRRDFILPNYCDTGFWSYMRTMYNADFIVIDAKNYSKKVQKKDVLQICNYIKQHGAGLFGIIITRNGGDQGCFHTIREMWSLQRKLIIVLSDDDIKQMLLLKSTGNNPEDILKQKIEQFRLSL